jgi:hypothetical protein
MAFTRPSKNLVIASERNPGMFRPSNQANLLAALPTNPSVSDPRTVLNGMGIVQSGNGPGDNGLTSGPGMTRFVDSVTGAREKRLRKGNMLQRAGSPNGPSADYTVMSFDRAAASMPNAPGTGKEMVARIRRDNNTSWQINKFLQYGQPVFEAVLVESTGSGQQALDQSPPLNTETDARNFIQAHEFQRTNVLPDTFNRASFERSLFDKTFKRKDVNATTSAMARMSQVEPYVDSPAPQAPESYQPTGYSNLTPHEVRMLELDGVGAYVESPAYQGSNGLGALDTKSLFVAAAAVGGLIFLLRTR